MQSLSPTSSIFIADPTVRAKLARQTPPPDWENHVRVSGRMFGVGDRDWHVKGLTYGPFRPNRARQFLPERHQLLADLDILGSLGCNAIRLYHPPTQQFLDDALARGIRVMIDVPWEKHRCFFEDWSARQDAIAAVDRTARELGNHPGLFAISVANEIPHDVVRFYGATRVGRFIEDLVERAKSQAPKCLVTYTNYPSTEFLAPRNLDFYCANVYLHDRATLGRYLDRLQHVAGNVPLILGEYGVDTIRHDESHQTEALDAHLHEVFRRGLAGSFIFSFTDEWFAGGQQIQDWAFGVTRADRSPKPAAQVVSSVWDRAPHLEEKRLPRVSVVVCSFDGAATLDECLRSLEQLDYPDYEVILVDDGSTDNTRQIAARFPTVRYLYQENQGLSGARNVGALVASGDVIAYTDSDCVADRRWLLYLVQTMEDQAVDAIGGPNVPPGSDAWTATCVAASPGGPSHVMLDDRRAEHVPGCNMAFRRDKLLELGGFDAQFRQAGDDVDICWRFLDAGMHIGFAPSALVWHHRRNTIRAYWKQQAGYGRSESMLQSKHPERFNRLGYSQWLGVIYGEGAVGLPVAEPSVYHGRFGSGLFQIIYRRNDYNLWAYFTLFEWHVLALLILATATLFPAVVVVSAAMWLLTLIAVCRSVAQVRLPKSAPRWCRLLIYWMHLCQPIVRGWHRHRHQWRACRIPHLAGDDRAAAACVKRISWRDRDLYWSSDAGYGREHLLPMLVSTARQVKWLGDFRAEWQAHDVELCGGVLHTISLRTATEEMGGPKRFTRVRCSVRWSGAVRLMLALTGIFTALAAFRGSWIGLSVAGTMALSLTACLGVAGYRCRRNVTRLVFQSGLAAGLHPAPVRQSQRANERQNERMDHRDTDEAELCAS
jgi:O-antigen biosynthesis protein